DVGRCLVGHPDQTRGDAAVRPHDLVRIGAVEQHHRLAVLVDGGDDAADVLAERHAIVLLLPRRPAKAGTQYPRACVITIERVGWISGYWVPAFAGDDNWKRLANKGGPLRPSRLIHRVAAGHRAHDLDVLDLVGIDRVWIIRKHHE